MRDADRPLPDGTAEHSALHTEELEGLSAAPTRAGGGGPRGLRTFAPVALVAGILGVAAWVGSGGGQQALSAPGPREVHVEREVSAAVLVFRTLTPTRGGLEVLDGPDPDAPGATWTLAVQEEAPGLEHRLRIPPAPGKTRRVRAVADGVRSLPHLVPTVGPTRVEIRIEAGLPGRVLVVTDPPLRGRLRLGSRGPLVVLTGAPGREEGDLPDPEEDDLELEATYLGVDRSGEKVQETASVVWGGTGGKLSYLERRARAAADAFIEGLVAPLESEDALVFSASDGAFQRPPPDTWYEDLEALSQALAAVEAVADEAQALLARDPGRSYDLYDALWVVTLMDGAFRRDAGRPGETRLGLERWVHRLVPPLEARPREEDRLGQPGPVLLHPPDTGLPPSFFARSRLRWELGAAPRAAADSVDLVVVADTIPMDVYLALRFGARRIALSPLLQPGAPEVARGRRAYACRVPASWVTGDAALTAGYVPGGFLGSALTAHGVFIWTTR